MAFWWVLGGVTVLVGAIVLRDKSTRHKVIRAMARSWERRQGRGSVSRRKSRKKATARAHLRERKATARNLPQAHRPFERPRRPRLVATKCTAACRTSRRPAYDRKTGRLLCDCPCGGREHGMYRKGATSQPTPPKRAAGTSGAKKTQVSTPKPAAAARPAAKLPTAAGPEKKAPTGGVTNINEGGTVGIQSSRGAPGTRVTNVNRGGVVGIQAGTVSGASVRPVSPTRPPEPPKTWRGLQVSSWSAMKAHAESSKRCAGGTFSAKTFRDRRHNPPKITQQMSCDTCGRAVS